MPRFTIRDLLWLTLAVALCCGNFVNSRHLVTAIRWLCDQVANHTDAIGAPLIGRKSVVSDWNRLDQP